MGLLLRAKECSRRRRVADGSETIRKRRSLKTHLNQTPTIINYGSKSISRRIFPLARRPGLRELLRALQRRPQVVVGSLLAGRRIFFLDHLPLDSGVSAHE